MVSNSHFSSTFCFSPVTPNNSSDPPRLLNYLTAPHVLVWSAAVASSSLPGVFEANRLMVKDADGTVRYESSERAAFSDGSMEQDLPMQQLSEMFNVNHFIVSQANPHAVMFASYNHLGSVWSNPISGFINSVLHFLKDQCRTWLANCVELVGARRIAPLHATSRGMMSSFFVQEYEGRDCDISLIPWLSHRGLISALMHCLYNPTEDEFTEWVKAAERETWKYLPAIKSHIAEEITLDRCVQRLRKRLAAESWEKRRSDSTGRKMGDRVPSFFTSPSLVNLSGLGVSDQTNIDGFEQYKRPETPLSNGDIPSSNGDMARTEPPIPPIDINHGWSGLGLRGNRSSGSLERSTSATSGRNRSVGGLERSTSATSGIFIDDEPSEEQQVAGEQTVPSTLHRPTSTSSFEAGNLGYFKTTSMAHFYYRYSSSHGNLLPASGSHGRFDTTEKTHQRRQSKSHADLTTPLNASGLN
jgi:predicted acylesterase/phospholipase RssA